RVLDAVSDSRNAEVTYVERVLFGRKSDEGSSRNSLGLLSGTRSQLCSGSGAGPARRQLPTAGSHRRIARTLLSVRYEGSGHHDPRQRLPPCAQGLAGIEGVT